MSASIWSPGTVNDIETVNADRTRKAQRFATPSLGQTDFTLTNFAYAVGTGSLQININGVQQFIGADFLETGNNSFRLVTPAEAEDVIDAFGLVGSPAAQSAASSAAQSGTYADAANASAAAAANSNTLAQAAQLLATNKATDSANSATSAANAASTAATNATNTVNATLAQKVTDAQAARDAASGYSNTASGYKDQAYQYKLDAAASAQTASNYAAAANGTQLNADWNEANPASKAFIVNKPSLVSYAQKGLRNAIANTMFAFNTPNGMATQATAGAPNDVPLVVTNNGGVGPAMMMFAREGNYAAYFGMDSDNVLKWGGYSIGSVAYTIYHSGNFTPANYVPISAGVILGGPLTFPNEVYIGWKNSSGVNSGAMGVNSANQLDIYGFGAEIRLRNKAGTRDNLTIADGANLTALGAWIQDNTITNPTNIQTLTNSNRFNIQWNGPGPNGTKNIRINAGTLEHLNSAFNTVIMSLTDTGTLSAAVITQTSDERKKKDWELYEPNLLEQFAQIKKVGNFKWKGTNTPSLGISAQSAQRIKSIANAVHTAEDGSLQVNTGGASLVLIHALTTRLLALEAEVKSLKGEH